MVLNRSVSIALIAAAILLAASQWRATATENVNWDEFALLARSRLSTQSGRLEGGGRPGLAALMLMPFVRHCQSSVEAVVAARKLWLACTIAYLAGVFVLVRQFAANRQDGLIGGALAVALLALVPTFLRWSLQVRTDQPALMFACWGGVLLLASCRRLALAPAAGAVFALGYLCTQKAVYVGALVGMLAVVRLARDLGRGRALWLRAGLMCGLAGASAVAVLALYRVAVAMFLEPARVVTLGRTLDTFAYYRLAFGFRAYWAMLPTLGPHIVCLGFLLPALLAAWNRPGVGRAAAIGSGLSLLLGFVVGAFHGGAFPYFWMTLGLFPAAAVGIGWTAIREHWSRPMTTMLLAVAGSLVLVSAVPSAIARHTDAQRVQRDALAFIDRNFPRTARGFQAESALFCRSDPEPFSNYFAEAVVSRLSGADGPPQISAFIGEFRNRPVSFMIAHRLFPFPEAIERFWSTHYVLYKSEVMIPGRRISGRRGDLVQFEAIAPGRYRWRPLDGSAARLTVDGIEHASVFALDAGTHTVTLLDDVTSGLLTLAVDDEPAPEGPPFYDPRAIRELDPLYPRPTAIAVASPPPPR